MCGSITFNIIKLDAWYTENDIEYVFGNTVSSDDIGKTIKLYSKFIENNKYTINYYDGDTLLKSLDNVYENTTLEEYNPSKEGFEFGQWCIDKELNIPFSDNIVKSNLNLYAKYIKSEYALLNNKMDVFSTLTENVINYKDTIFTLNVGLYGEEYTKAVLPNGNKSEYIIRTGGNSDPLSTDNKVRTIEFTAPLDGTVEILFSASGTDRGILLFENDTQINEAIYAKEANNNSITLGKYNVEIGHTYEIGSINGIYIFEVKFIPSTSAHLNYQYNNDTTPTAVRFFGTLSNISDTTKIESITLTFESEGKTSTKSINKIWKSVNVETKDGDAGITFEEKANTYYVVYSVTNITDALGTEFSVTLTITFVNESILEVLATNRTFVIGQIQ